MKSKKGLKILKGFLIGIGLTFATLFVLVAVFLYILAGGPAEVTKDVEKYEEIFAESGMHTGYMVFPERIPESATDIKYYHSYRDTLNTPTVQTFLQCTYDDKTYQKEIDRLENCHKTYGNEVKRLLRDTEQKYPYPAYIAVENAAHTYEYALLTGNNQIAYIFTEFIYEDDIKFDKKYLPKDYMTEEGRSFGSGYSIYYVKVSSDAIDSDYTRDQEVEVTDAHLRNIDDDFFAVYYTLDKEGREIITGCAYWKYNGMFDIDKCAEYEDLNGTEYVNLEVDRVKKTATVTYIEEGVTKTKIYNKPTND